MAMDILGINSGSKSLESMSIFTALSLYHERNSMPSKLSRNFNGYLSSDVHQHNAFLNTLDWCWCWGLKSTVPVDGCQDLGLSVIEVWYLIDFMELDVLPNVPIKWESILGWSQPSRSKMLSIQHDIGCTTSKVTASQGKHKRCK